MRRAGPFRLDQLSECLLQTEESALFQFRYAYTPSADSLRDHEPGQDYLAFNDLGSAFIFAACDGVGQSFYGNLAARFLGDALVAWLAEPAPDASFPSAADLSAFLLRLTHGATDRVDEQPVPTEPPILHSVLLEKRARGSEAMFVCGRIDLETPDGSAGRIFLAWMGDMRVGLWRANRRVALGGRHATDERWSSRRGPIGGDVHTYCGSLSAEEPFSRLVVYSDGLKALDEIAGWRQSGESLGRLIRATNADPESDDVTYFELGLVLSRSGRPVRPSLEAAPPSQNRTAERAIALPAAPEVIPAEPKARWEHARIYALLGSVLLISLLAVAWLVVNISFGARDPLLSGDKGSIPPIPTLASTAKNNAALPPVATPTATPSTTPTVTPSAAPTATPSATPTGTQTATAGNTAIEALLNRLGIKTG